MYGPKRGFCIFSVGGEKLGLKRHPANSCIRKMDQILRGGGGWGESLGGQVNGKEGGFSGAITFVGQNRTGEVDIPKGRGDLPPYLRKVRIYDCQRVKGGVCGGGPYSKREVEASGGEESRILSWGGTLEVSRDCP